MSDRQAELFEAEAEPERLSAGRVSFLVPAHLPTYIPHDGTWRITTQPSGGRLVELVPETEAPADG